MDYLAIVLAVLAAVAGFLSDHPNRPGWARVGIAVALLALALICQFTEITRHAWINTH